MAVALTLQKYLADKNVRYDVIAHELTGSSMQTADRCRDPATVSPKRSCSAMRWVMPSRYCQRRATFGSQNSGQLGDDVGLATEREAAELFQDCTRGALPAVGECYGLDMVVDDSIEEQPEVYLEGGDHRTLIHMSHAQFATLTATARHGRFSVHN